MTPAAPFLQVRRGEPDDVELAAVTVALLALARTRAASAADSASAGPTRPPARAAWWRAANRTRPAAGWQAQPPPWLDAAAGP